MSDWRDEVRQDYEEFKKRLRDTTLKDFQSGGWFAEFVQWLLQNYAKTVDAAYIRRNYPGLHPANQARKAITLAARHNAIAGGTAAAAITGLELSSIGPQAVVTVPAVATLVLADVAYCTRTQLRSTYDLSIIHGAPLSLDDVENCYLVFLTAMGVKLYELAGSLGKAVGPKVVVYNVRRLLRTGLRRALQEVLQRVGGARLARALTERAMMRLLVPGINVPIATGMNYYFTRQILNVANEQMTKRGAVVQPLIRLYKREPNLDKMVAPKILITIGDSGDPEGWSEGQMGALRHCQSTLSLDDGDLARLDAYFDRTVNDIVQEIPPLLGNSVDDVLDLAIVLAALATDDRHDIVYAETIVQLAGHLGTILSTSEVIAKIRQKRRRLS